LSHSTGIKNQNKIGGTCGRQGTEKNDYRILVGNHEEKTPFHRPSPVLEDNIKIELKTGWESVEWIYLAQGR
jgi:hypothetical protein